MSASIVDITDYETAYSKILEMFLGDRQASPREQRVLEGLDALKKIIKGWNPVPQQCPCSSPLIKDEKLTTAYADMIEVCNRFPADAHNYAVNYLNCLFTDVLVENDLFVGDTPPDSFFKAVQDISPPSCTPDESVDPFRPKPEETMSPTDIGGCNQVGSETNSKRLQDVAADPLKFVSLDDAKRKISIFVEKGGQYYVAPKLDEKQKDKGLPKEVILDGGFKIHLQDGDVVIPICHEGMNRSQILYLALHALKKRCCLKNLTIAKPHGAESGFDPHQAYDNLDTDNVYGYIHGVILPRGSDGEWLHDNFYNVFQTEKSLRIGADVTDTTNLNPDQSNPNSLPEMFANLADARQKKRKQMNSILFSPAGLRSRLKKPATNKVILFCFCRASLIVLERILEQNEEDCSNICIVALPWYDNISRAGGEDEQKALVAALEPPGASVPTDLAEIEAFEKKHGIAPTRDSISKYRHKLVFELYSSFLGTFPEAAKADITVTLYELEHTFTTLFIQLQRLQMFKQKAQKKLTPDEVREIENAIDTE